MNIHRSLLSWLVLLLMLLPLQLAFAQDPEQTFVTGEVMRVDEVNDEVQQVIVRIEDVGADTEIMLTNDVIEGRPDLRLEVGQNVVLEQVDYGDGTVSYALYETYRFPVVMVALGLFFILAALIGRRRGVSALIGLILSIGLIVFVLFPMIINGWNPLVAGILISFVIACITILVSHGIRLRTFLALLATCITLVIAIGLAMLAVSATALYGFGSEESVFLYSAFSQDIDIRGLFLAGIIIGTLGILDDVTAAQVAAIDEVSQANPHSTFRSLYRAGISVGNEHVASMINTLALAYAGASLPLLLLFFLDSQVPGWVMLNSAFLAEELVRTVIGSAALLLAVPIATWLGAFVFSRRGDHKIVT
jgi:uncharacterized membrane protein